MRVEVAGSKTEMRGGPTYDVLRRALELGRSKRASSADSLRAFRFVGSSQSPVIAGQTSLVGFAWRNHTR